jgi:DnaJ-class molecular chaperone
MNREEGTSTTPAMSRYRQVLQPDGDPVIVNVDGVAQFVFAKESCKHCNGKGHVGFAEQGCPECLGMGKKFGFECPRCGGSGDSGEGQVLPCFCVKKELELDERAILVGR